MSSRDPKANPGKAAQKCCTSGTARPIRDQSSRTNIHLADQSPRLTRSRFEPNK